MISNMYFFFYSLHSLIFVNSLFIYLFIYSVSHNRSWVRVRQKKRSPNLLQIPNLGIGKRISLQSLFNQTQAHRDRQRSMPNRASNQNLVPKSAHEVEERDQSNFYCTGDRIDGYFSGDREGDRRGDRRS